MLSKALQNVGCITHDANGDADLLIVKTAVESARTSTTVVVHIKLCLLLWFEFFRTIALLLRALRDLIVRYSKWSSGSVKCRREIFGRANFHPRVVSLGINVSSKVGDDGRRTGEGKELCRPTEKTLRHYSLDFSTSIYSVYTDVLNMGILLLDNYTKRKNIKVGSQIFKICFLVNFVFKT